jgi:hypothetical protein
VKVCPFFVAHAQSIAQSLLSSHPAPKGFSPQVRQRPKTQLPSGQDWLPWQSEAPRSPQSLLRLSVGRIDLLRKLIAILFRPVALRRHRLHRRATLSSTGAGPFHLGLGHAKAGFRFQASADIYDLLTPLGLTEHSARERILMLVLRSTARRNEG